ncbi:MAG: ribonuclease HI [Anaerolineae bacterium]|nr:ribonuclease HI [Anaerolineae bacterium]
MSKPKKKQYYVVVAGHNPGIYTQWYGEDGAADQVEGFPEAIYKGFYTREQAIEWLKQFSRETLSKLAPNLLDLLDPIQPTEVQEPSLENMLQAGKVVIFTDGGAIDNPGPGGYGVVLRYKEHRRELSEGFRRTTNNRMELWACIAALSALKKSCDVILYSDSSYVVNGITQGWAKRWQANGWMRNKEDKAENVDLWEQLLDLCSRHTVTFRWVKGHAGNEYNERCDQLATQAACSKALRIDESYEQGRTQIPALSLFSSK